MKALSSFLLIFFSSSTLQAGMPVVDTNEVLKQLSDSLYFISSIDGLLNEVGVNGEEAASMMQLSREIQEYQKELALINQLQLATNDASQMDMGRSRVLIDQINSVTRHIQRIKRAIMLAKSIGARPDAINSSMRILREERLRDKERFEIALETYEERERIAKLRRQMERQRGLHEAIENENEAIRRFSQKSGPRAIEFKKSNHLINHKEGLW